MTVVLAVLAALNLVSFALFGIDKRRARTGAWRISEATLVVSGLVSGTVGAWLGVYAFRHKTRKASFLVKLAAASVVDVLVLAALVFGVASAVAADRPAGLDRGAPLASGAAIPYVAMVLTLPRAVPVDCRLAAEERTC